MKEIDSKTFKLTKDVLKDTVNPNDIQEADIIEMTCHGLYTGNES
jgi:hypothetical protein